MRLWLVRSRFGGLFRLSFAKFFELAAFFILNLRVKHGFRAIYVSGFRFPGLACCLGLLFGQFETGQACPSIRWLNLHSRVSR